MRFLTPAYQSRFLFLALILYACFSSPTPDVIGLPEYLIALLLCLSVRMDVVATDKRLSMMLVTLGYGLSIPLICGIIRGQEIGDIVRDVVPFLYLLLPLFIGWVGAYSPYRFLAVLAGIGIAFSIRTIFSYQSILWTPSLWGKGPPADLLYLANSPEVLFSALFCLGMGGHFVMMKEYKAYGALLCGLSVVPMVAMALMMQRASIGVVILYIIVVVGAVIYHRPKWGAGFAVMIAAAICLLWNIIDPILEMAWHKTELVGLNARTQEWGAVLSQVTSDVSMILFGEGWGGRIESPAVGGLSVNYTHSLISSLLLKTGFLGAFVILAGCLTPVFLSLRRLISQKNAFDWLLMGAALPPFLISVFLYASYKSLGFGLILLVFFIFPIRKLEKF